MGPGRFHPLLGALSHDRLRSLTRTALPGRESVPADRAGLLVAARRPAHRPALAGHVGRAGRRPGHRLGAGGPVDRPAQPDRAGRVLGPGTGRRGGPAARPGGPAQGRARRARPDREPAPHAAERAALRVLLGGSAAHRGDRGRLRARRAGARRRHHGQAPGRERLRDRADDRGRADPGAGAARALPGAVRAGRAGRRMGRDERLQRGQRRLDGPERPLPGGDPEGRVGLRRGGRLRLAGRPGHRGSGARRPGHRHAGDGQPVGRETRRGGPVRRRSHRGHRRQGTTGAVPRSPRGRARRLPVAGVHRGRRRGGGPPGGVPLVRPDPQQRPASGGVEARQGGRDRRARPGRPRPRRR